MSYGPDGQVTNRTGDHRVQDQNSLAQSIYVDYCEHVARDAESHVHCL